MAKITQDTAKYVPGKTPISTHHGQPIDVNAPAAPVMDQTYDMNAEIPGVDAGSYQFDLTGAAPLSWGTSTFHAGTPRRPAQMQDVPAIGLYERNPNATPEDLGREARSDRMAPRRVLWQARRDRPDGGRGNEAFRYRAEGGAAVPFQFRQRPQQLVPQDA